MTHTRLWSVFLLIAFMLALPAMVVLAQPEKDKAKAPDAKQPAPATKDAAKADPVAPDPTKAPPKPDQPTAVDATVTLTIEQVDAAIKQTQDSTDLDDEAKATIIKQWTDAKSELTAEASERAEAAKAKQQLETLPVETERIKKEVEEAAKSPVPPFTLTLTPQTTSKQLESQLTSAKTELADRQQALTRLEDQLKTLKDEPTKLRDDLKKAQADLEAAEKALAAPPVAGENARLTAARKARLDAARRARRATIARIEQQLLTYDVRGPYLAALHDQAAALVPPADQKVKVLQEALTKLLKEETDRAAAEAERARIDAMHKDPQIFKLTETNAEAAKKNAELAKERTALESQVAEAKKLVEGIRKELADAEKKVKERGLDKRLARDLIKRRRNLPNTRQMMRAIDQMEAREREIEAAQEALQARRKELDSIDEVVKGIMARVGDTTTVKQAEIEAEVRKLLNTQKEIIGNQLVVYDTLFQQKRELHALSEATIEETTRFSEFIDENLLWIADAEPISLGSVSDAGHAATWLIDPQNWTSFLEALRQEAVAKAVPSAIALLLFAAAFFVRRRVNAALTSIDTQLKRIDTDHFSLTPRAVLLTLLLALPWPALLVYVAILVGQSRGPSEFPPAAAAGLSAAAIGYYMLRTLLHLIKPQGVCEAHLRWTAQATSILRRNLLWLLVLVPPSAFVVATLMAYEQDSYIDSLARFIYIGFMVAIAIFLFRVLHPSRGAIAQTLKENPRSILARTSTLWITLTLLMPLAPAVLAAIGYFYTARQIGGSRLSLSLWMLMGILLLHGLLLRWLYVAQRKLALQKAREKREARATAAATSGESPPEAVGAAAVAAENTIDIAQINEQTRQIVRSLLAVTTVIGFYLIWSGVLPALRVLDQLNLWAHSTRPDGTPAYITLANVLIAILIGFLTTVASKNLPGLLEITILKRTPLDAGGRYAFATITRYVISAVGIVAAFQAIGVGWSQVQWLVAAVSLGLGFGLQEIFANFVSGLIILFERPIRVGDVVTVGDTSGTVSRIRIRATTIVNFERKELIVPNKEFITSRVLNWTLSDTVTRVSVSVGVAYGTNLQLVQRILAEQAKANPAVMEDPAPVVVIDGFGDSSINFTVHTFVRVMADRLGVINGLHDAIDRAFRQNNLEIPFPQRDLHVRTVSPGVSFTGNGHGEGQGQPGGNGEDKKSAIIVSEHAK